MAKKVIIDVDPGIDDALALAIALFDPGLDVLAVTATGGNVSPEQATTNLQALIAYLDPPRTPRIGIATEKTKHIWNSRLATKIIHFIIQKITSIFNINL
mgnify:CR=1 FL=1